MRRLLYVFAFVAGLGISVYFTITRMILPHVEERNLPEYIVLGALVVTAIATGVTTMMFIYRNKDKKINWLNNRLKQWTNLSVHVNRAGDEVFKYLPIGILIYNQDLRVKWVNNYAKEIFSDDIIEKPLSDLNLGLLNYVSDHNAQNIIEVENRFYEIKQKDDEKIIYLFDITEQEVLSRKYTNRTLAVGILALDNIEMETKTFDLQEAAQIRGDFLGEISDWVEEYDGYLKNYDDDSLMFIVDRENLNKMIENKFQILDKIREISTRNNIRVSLSGGVACGDETYKELGNLAQSAIDLAEKRGGDQVVVNILGDKIQYFGAKLNAVEKNNLLAARANTLAFKDQIEQSNEVYIMGHNMADADAIGAMIGVLKMVLTSKKNVKVVMDYYRIDQTSQRIYENIKEKEPELMNYFTDGNSVGDVSSDALMIVVDTQSPKIAMNENLLYKFRRIAVIDHHRSNDEGFGETVFSYIEPYASSTVELISEMFQFYQKDSVAITAFEATIMLAGLVVDTNNFTFRCGTRTFEAASLLKEKGADMIDIRRLLRNDLDFQVQLAKYVQKCEIILNKFAICQFDPDDVISDRTVLARVADYLLNIDNVEAAFAIANYDENQSSGVAISARSYKDVNVQLIMEEMGGGGHLNGAATQISDREITTVKEDLIEILKRDFEIGDEKMKVILLEDVKGRGDKNQVIEVASGYGNYLVTNKKAILATDENLAQLKENLKRLQEEEEQQRKLMQKIKEDIEKKSVNIYIKVGQDNKLYGHVTTKQICDEFEAQTGIHLDKKKVSLPVEINSLGTFQALVDLHKDIKATFEINVLEK